jgi:hypothetical protein
MIYTLGALAVTMSQDRGYAGHANFRLSLSDLIMNDWGCSRAIHQFQWIRPLNRRWHSLESARKASSTYVAPLLSWRSPESPESE